MIYISGIKWNNSRNLFYGHLQTVVTSAPRQTLFNSHVGLNIWNKKQTSPYKLPVPR